ncbi:hypothetical protein ACFC1R_26855 [Kitasatospora sp. NPDC056138]|uniref:hypothetical protein n=1 Tax=Kitasatospora sp. NPDC056138 TaxID=3345724 RepID=UPI0035D603E5
MLTDAGSDTLRRHVLSDRPEGRPAEFRLDGLDRTRDHLHAGWNQRLSRLFSALREDCAGLTPEEEPGGTGWDLLAERLDFSAREIRSSYGVSGTLLADDAARIRQVMSGVPDDLVLRAVGGWTGVFGWLGFELSGQFEGTMLERSAAFDHQLRCLAVLVGLPGS